MVWNVPGYHLLAHIVTFMALFTLWRLRPWRRHSLVVGIGGAVYLTYGLVEYINGGDPVRMASLGVLGVLSHVVWGTVWVLVGALAVLSTRWPPSTETWGYAALAALAALWSSGYVSAWVLGGPPTAPSGGLVWALVAVLWWGISGLRNPDDLPPPPGPRHGE